MGVVTAAALVVAAISAVAAVKQGQDAKSQAKFQANIQEQQADRARDVAAADERDFRRKQSFLLSQRRAALGASGVRSDTGSPLLASQDFENEVELQSKRIREGGEIRATRLEQEAQLFRRAGSNALFQGFARAGSSLLSGAGRAFG
jgi:hypothetical protein